MKAQSEGDYKLTVNGKTFDLEEEVYDLLLATSKERDILRENYASLESDYDVVNERALETALRLAKLDKDFAEEFENDVFWKTVAAHVRDLHLNRKGKRPMWS